MNTTDPMDTAQEAAYLHHLQGANAMLAAGNVPQAELHFLNALQLAGRTPAVVELDARIRQGYGLAQDFTLCEKSAPASHQKRFLLIQSWGYGFWSETHHLLSQLLLAELTHRTPIVHWGRNCLFRAPSDENAFGNFFKPVSAASLADIPPEASFFPPKWNADNLLEGEINKWDGAFSRMAAPYFFDRPETVVVGDFFSTINSIIPWLDPRSRYYGMSDNALYAELFRMHIRPQDHIMRRVMQFGQEKMRGRNWIAVHIRGSDKVLESPHLPAINASYHPLIERILEVSPQVGIFLLTDSAQVVEEYSARYGERLCFAPAHRTQSQVGVHMSGIDGVTTGVEVLVDALLAIHCDYFVGNRESNVSQAISSMKNWGEGYIFLLGIRNIRDDDFVLHNRGS